MATQNEEPAIYVSQITVEPTIQPEGLTAGRFALHTIPNSAGLAEEEEAKARGEGSQGWWCEHAPGQNPQPFPQRASMFGQD